MSETEAVYNITNNATTIVDGRDELTILQDKFAKMEQELAELHDVMNTMLDVLDAQRRNIQALALLIGR